MLWGIELINRRTRGGFEDDTVKNVFLCGKGEIHGRERGNGNAPSQGECFIQLWVLFSTSRSEFGGQCFLTLKSEVKANLVCSQIGTKDVQDKGVSAHLLIV